MIAHHSVQQVLDTANAVDVISEFIQLRQRGANHLGLCPFHNEKTPSFTVSPTKNIYKCFGCGKAGNAVGFLMEHEKLSFPEAIRYLAKMYSIELVETQVSEENKELQEAKNSLFVITDRAQKYYSDQLMHTAQGKSIALAYFKKRGFLLKTIEKFGLGYASDLRDGLTSTMVTEGYNIELLRKTGLTTKYDNDFFRARIIFPIFSMSGKVIAFAGRTMHTDPKIPKYINSPETEIYEKRKILYGLNFSRKAIQKEKLCILVEGYTDVISLHQAGIEHVVASSGTSLTVEQIRLIKRYTDTILVLFDGDQAGLNAASRGVHLILEQDLNVRVVILPEKQDPDSYVRELGAKAFREYLDEEAKDFILYRATQLANLSAGDPVKKSALIEEVILSISMIGNPVKRSLYVKECSQIFQIGEKAIIDSLNKKINKRLKQKQREKLRTLRQDKQLLRDEEKQVATPTTLDTDYYQERDVIRLVVSQGHQLIDTENNQTVSQYILEKLDTELDQLFIHPVYKSIILELDAKLKEKKAINPNYWVNHSDVRIATLAANLCASPHSYSENWAKMWKIYLQMQPMPEKNLKRDSFEAVSRLLLHYFKQLSKKNQARIIEHKDDPKRIRDFLIVQKKINTKINQLSEALGTVVL